MADGVRARARFLLQRAGTGIVALTLFCPMGLDSVAAVPPFRPGWRLVWADEFEGPDGSRPNPEWWTFDLGGGGWGNNELQTYTDRTRNCRIERGLLVVEAHRETYTGADGITRNYTSARLKTQGRVAFRYGRIEARIRVPRGQGLWPAFWMLGTNFPSVGWPQCGEIDIMENIGREPGTVYGTLHGPGYAGGNAVGGRYTLPHGAALADDFHVFAVEWETNRMRWFIDDILYFTATPASLPVGRTWVFEQPFFLILNVAVGGNWPGSPDATTVFPQRMLVDHVRVYEREDPTRAGCGGNVLWNGGFELGSWGGWLRMGTNVALQGPGGGSARHGGYALRVGASGGGVNTRSGVYQVWPVRPGERFRAAGWTLTPAAQPLTGDSRVWLELSFWDAEGRLRALYRSVALNATALRGHWMRLEVTNRFDPLTHAWIEGATELLAPAGAVGARYEVVLESTSGGGAALWDDLECVAQPSPPIAVEVDRRPEGLLVQFPTCPGARYVVLATPVLAPAEWSVERWWWGDGQVAGLLLPWSSSSRFYTVQRW